MRHARVLLSDFVAALALFWIVVFSLGGHHNHAHAVVPTPSAAEVWSAWTKPTWFQATHFSADIRAKREPQAGYTQTFLLSVTFAALVALNLAFWRHLRRVYASPRRGVWRRD